MNLIKIDNPQQIKSKRVYNQLEKMVNSGIKDISIEMNFICPDDIIIWIMNEFRLLKNDLCFNRDIRTGKFNK